MLCERCQKNEASIHLTEIIKDVKSEVHLCENCARKIGLNAKLSNFTLSVPEMLSFLEVSEIEESSDCVRCKSCGLSFIDYNREGKLGCPDCYTHMKDSLENVIVSYHGEKRHAGKYPVNTRGTRRPLREKVALETRSSVNDLMRDLEKAVHEERYEDAALLRDRIAAANKEQSEVS